ncbi:MAG: hypothetical protein ABUK01_00890 [Leptospirales bacterium]
MLCEQKGIKLIILDLPQPQYNPVINKKMAELEEKYMNLAHIRIPENMLIKNDIYFADQAHLNDNGRAYYMPYVLKLLKQNL